MRNVLYVASLMLLSLTITCKKEAQKQEAKKAVIEKIRKVHDTIGFAQYAWQMDSIYSRLGIVDGPINAKWKMAICPHDDYKYAGALYHKSLEGIQANTIILIGVAHKARNYDLQDKIVFGTHQSWQSPYGELKVSDWNQKIYRKLPPETYTVHDDMMELEHSLEAIIPFLHKKNKDLKIVPILVPYMQYADIEKISTQLAAVVAGVMDDAKKALGEDVAIIISNDAVHYGDEQWSANLAPYGTDAAGTKKARQHDLRIIKECLTGTLDNQKILQFTQETVKAEDYKEYKWIWCGRYSVPFGLAFGNKLNLIFHSKALKGVSLGYSSSIDHELIKVEDLGMGTTAIATNRHWVAYTGVAYQ
ncbi:MAG: AmmeMemoRadiSam system protein B [Flavobacteriaceae bacterium]|nr:AmmeMemoRadiSam system protein B [Flavobacteriaceae bacterium]